MPKKTKKELYTNFTKLFNEYSALADTFGHLARIARTVYK